MRLIKHDDLATLARMRLDFLRLGLNCSEIEGDHFYVFDLDSDE